MEPDARPGDAMSNRAVMDRIAGPFDATRQSPWPQVLGFLGGIPEGERVLDLGGGNGRHSRAAAERGVRPILLDVSGALVRLARQNASAARSGTGGRLDAVEADARHIPLADGCVRYALFIAALHCIRGRTARVETLRDLRRVVAPGGRALVSVWSAGQTRFRDMVAAQRSTAETLAAGDEVGDVIVPWARGTEEPVARFYHVYEAEELRGELEDAGWTVETIEAVQLADKAVADNWFADVRAP